MYSMATIINNTILRSHTILHLSGAFMLFINFGILPSHMNLMLTSPLFQPFNPLFYSRPFDIEFIQCRALI